MKGFLLTVALFVFPNFEPPNNMPVLFEHGTVSVREEVKRSDPVTSYKYLMCAGVHWGLQYDPPLPGNPDLTRLPTTYYSRKGPAGRMMKRFDWFPNEKNSNTFWADARMPVSLVGFGANPLSMTPLPTTQLVGLWSEPPVATLGIGPGTLAAYLHPYQTLDIYEPDKLVVRLSRPKKGKRYFTYLHDARKRGANVRIFVGNERKTLTKRGPERFYHAMFVELCQRNWYQGLKVETLTKEGMAKLFESMAERGVVCYHTSHRYIDNPPVVVDVAKSLGYATRTALDSAPEYGAYDYAHFQSEWVFVARRPEYFRDIKAPENYAQKVRETDRRRGLPRIASRESFWQKTRVTGRHAWTDESAHKLDGILFSSPRVIRTTRRYIDWAAYLSNQPIYTPSWVYDLAHARARVLASQGKTVEDLP